MSNITTDTAARSAGFTKPAIATGHNTEIHILIRPATDFAKPFQAFHRNRQEIITIQGLKVT